MWKKESITPGEIDALREAARRAWAEDTRDHRWEGHPLSHGQCYVTSRWLMDRLGGSVARKEGHYVWLAPGGQHIIDLGCGHCDYRDVAPGSYHRHNAPQSDRALRFARRANRIFDGLDRLLKLGDQIGDAYPAEEPEREDLNHRDDPGPLLHDEPDYQPHAQVYKFVFANGQLEVSPEHDHTELAQHAGVPLDHTGPMATGYISVVNGTATFEVQSNVDLNVLVKTFKDYAKTVGWRWGGMTNLEGEPISDDFAPTKRAHYAYVWANDHLWVGRTTVSEVALTLPRVAGQLYGGRIEVEDGRAYVSGYAEAVPALYEWAEDNGLTLYALNDNVVKKWEDNQQFNNGDPEMAQSNMMSDPEDATPMRTPAGMYVCPGCDRLFPGWEVYTRHRKECPSLTEPLQDGHFPEPDPDSNFGDGAHWTEMKQEPGIHTGNWEPPGWNESEPYGPHGRCPMCKNPNLLAMDHNLICPECNWAGEKFDPPKETILDA